MLHKKDQNSYYIGLYEKTGNVINMKTHNFVVFREAGTQFGKDHYEYDGALVM